MSIERKSVRVEVWPLAADAHGIWLCSGDRPWLSDPVDSDHTVHDVVEGVVRRYSPADYPEPTLLHSPSWRDGDSYLTVTYVAVMPTFQFVADVWLRAKPVSDLLIGVVGAPEPHGAADVPEPRDVDVLHHAVRHLTFLADTDGDAAAVLVGAWRLALPAFTPALAGMYNGGQWAGTPA